ncbi:MAG TPA: MFS transporter [Streptosporangiaceae bacterium]
MATKAETNAVYAAGLIQGVALVTFPTASTIFTDPSQYGLSNTQYGAMFLPQAVTAITGSLLAGKLAQRLGTKRVFLAGLLADLASMALLIVSQFFTANQPVAYGLLLVATACLGIGFGLTVPAINALTAAFHPDNVDGSVLVLNALLGLGTTLAPVFVAIFVGLGFWWGLPLMSSVLLLVLIAVSTGLSLRAGAREQTATERTAGIPRLFWVFAAFAVLYGFCETMNGNWSQLDMTKDLHASTTQASFALTAFWGMVTVGRVLFALVTRWFPAQRTYHVLPFLLAATFVVIAALPAGTPAAGILTFALAGFGCSALLPLTISFGQEQLLTMGASVAGAVIAFYQVGYGIAAFGTGPLVDAGVGLHVLFGFAAIAAVIMGGLSFTLARKSAAKVMAPAPSS